MDLGSLSFGGITVVLVTYLAITFLGPQYQKQGDSEILMILNEAMNNKLLVSILVGLLATSGFLLSQVIAEVMRSSGSNSYAL